MKKLIIAASLLALSTPVLADDYLREVAAPYNRNAVHQADASAKEVLLRQTTLRQGQSGRTQLPVTRGKAYTIWGDCDTNCSNIDMFVLDGREVLKAEETSKDDPVFSFTANKTGNLTILTTMKECRSDECEIQTNAFEGNKVLEDLEADSATSASYAENPAGWLPEAQRINRSAVNQLDRNAREVLKEQGSLANGRNVNHAVRLVAGKNYRFFADCGYDCNDIDLRLKQNGRTIESALDTPTVDAPEMIYRPRQSGEYQLNVSMKGCRNEECAYSVQAFESNRRLDTTAHTRSRSDNIITQARETNRSVVHRADPHARLYQQRLVNIRNGANYTMPINLTAGKVYTFYGDCDVSCHDIDMVLKRGGQEVKADRLNDDVPLFSYRAPSSGRYTIEVPMKSCEANTCRTSIQVYQGSRMVYED